MSEHEQSTVISKEAYLAPAKIATTVDRKGELEALKEKDSEDNEWGQYIEEEKHKEKGTEDNGTAKEIMSVQEAEKLALSQAISLRRSESVFQGACSDIGSLLSAVEWLTSELQNSRQELSEFKGSIRSLKSNFEYAFNELNVKLVESQSEIEQLHAMLDDKDAELVHVKAEALNSERKHAKVVEQMKLKHAQELYIAKKISR